MESDNQGLPGQAPASYTVQLIEQKIQQLPNGSQQVTDHDLLNGEVLGERNVPAAILLSSSSQSQYEARYDSSNAPVRSGYRAAMRRADRAVVS